jgi:hypothetical protein
MLNPKLEKNLSILNNMEQREVTLLNMIKQKNIDEYVNDASPEIQYDKYVSKGEFGSFYRFNFDSSNFKSSLIGKLYDKYNFQNVKFENASSEAKEAASDIF